MTMGILPPLLRHGGRRTALTTVARRNGTAPTPTTLPPLSTTASVVRPASSLSSSSVTWTTPPSPTERHRLRTPRSSLFSTTPSSDASAPGFFSSLKSKFSPSPSTTPNTTATTATSTTDSQYAAQFRAMAESPTWTLVDVSRQLDENLTAMTKGWKNLVPGVRGQNKAQVEALREEKDIVEAAVAVLGGGGGGVGMEELRGMDRKEKLRISIASGVSPGTVNTFVDNFESVSIMHRILRYRNAEGLPLPNDEEEAKRMMQSDVQRVMTVKERKGMQKKRLKGGRRGR